MFTCDAQNGDQRWRFFALVRLCLWFHCLDRAFNFYYVPCPRKQQQQQRWPPKSKHSIDACTGMMIKEIVCALSIESADIDFAVYLWIALWSRSSNFNWTLISAPAPTKINMVKILSMKSCVIGLRQHCVWPSERMSTRDLIHFACFVHHGLGHINFSHDLWYMKSKWSALGAYYARTHTHIDCDATINSFATTQREIKVELLPKCGRCSHVTFH